MKDFKCPKCKSMIERSAEICPHCRTAWTIEEVAARTSKRNREMGIGCLTLTLLLGFCVWQTQPDEKQMADQKARGFHCAPTLDGSIPTFVAAVKARLRDPDSFEQIETFIAPVDKNGMHAVRMTYRANNGFGGKNVAEAHGAVMQSNCAAEVFSLEDRP